MRLIHFVINILRKCISWADVGKYRDSVLGHEDCLVTRDDLAVSDVNLGSLGSGWIHTGCWTFSQVNPYDSYAYDFPWQFFVDNILFCFKDVLTSDLFLGFSQGWPRKCHKFGPWTRFCRASFGITTINDTICLSLSPYWFLCNVLTLVQWDIDSSIFLFSFCLFDVAQLTDSWGCSCHVSVSLYFVSLSLSVCFVYFCCICSSVCPCICTNWSVPWVSADVKVTITCFHRDV